MVGGGSTPPVSADAPTAALRGLPAAAQKAPKGPYDQVRGVSPLLHHWLTTGQRLWAGGGLAGLGLGAGVSMQPKTAGLRDAVRNFFTRQEAIPGEFVHRPYASLPDRLKPFYTGSSGIDAGKPFRPGGSEPAGFNTRTYGVDYQHHGAGADGLLARIADNLRLSRKTGDRAALFTDHAGVRHMVGTTAGGRRDGAGRRLGEMFHFPVGGGETVPNPAAVRGLAARRGAALESASRGVEDAALPVSVHPTGLAAEANALGTRVPAAALPHARFDELFAPNTRTRLRLGRLAGASSLAGAAGGYASRPAETPTKAASAFHRPENYDPVADMPRGRKLYAGANDWEAGWTWAWVQRDGDGEPEEFFRVDHSDCPGCKGGDTNVSAADDRKCVAHGKAEVRAWAEGMKGVRWRS